MTVCIVDDVEQNARYIKRVLSAYETHTFYDPLEAADFCEKNQVDMLVSDQRMPGMSGLELVRRVKEAWPDVVVIIVSAYTDSEELVDAVNSNLVYKYIVKPFTPAALLQHVTRGWEQAELRLENRRLQAALNEQNRTLREENRALRNREQPFLDVFAGENPAVRELEESARHYAAADQPVLITGETGTGKELLARAVHALSPRREQPFLPVNCSALQEHLLESQLFGHAKGAFTGADANRIGILRAVDGGTLFLDEIGDLPLSLQPRLLRVLQFGTFIPVGEHRERRVDVRIISATNRDLRLAVESGGFREDLLYRINTLQLHLPALRERREDIPAILERIARNRGIAVPAMSPGAREIVVGHRFSGNIRELQSILDRLLILCISRGTVEIDEDMAKRSLRSGGEVPRSIPASMGGEVIPESGEVLDLSSYVEQVRRTIIEGVLAQEDGNISRTARRLKLSRQGLKNSLLRYAADESNA